MFKACSSPRTSALGGSTAGGEESNFLDNLLMLDIKKAPKPHRKPVPRRLASVTSRSVERFRPSRNELFSRSSSRPRRREDSKRFLEISQSLEDLGVANTDSFDVPTDANSEVAEIEQDDRRWRRGKSSIRQDLASKKNLRRRSSIHSRRSRSRSRKSHAQMVSQHSSRPEPKTYYPPDYSRTDTLGGPQTAERLFAKCPAISIDIQMSKALSQELDELSQGCRDTSKGMMILQSIDELMADLPSDENMEDDTILFSSSTSILSEGGNRPEINTEGAKQRHKIRLHPKEPSLAFSKDISRRGSLGNNVPLPSYSYAKSEDRMGSQPDWVTALQDTQKPQARRASIDRHALNNRPRRLSLSFVDEVKNCSSSDSVSESLRSTKSNRDTLKSQATETTEKDGSLEGGLSPEASPLGSCESSSSVLKNRESNERTHQESQISQGRSTSKSQANKYSRSRPRSGISKRKLHARSVDRDKGERGSVPGKLKTKVRKLSYHRKKLKDMNSL